MSSTLLQLTRRPVFEKYVNKYILDQFIVFKADRWFDWVNNTWVHDEELVRWCKR